MHRLVPRHIPEHSLVLYLRTRLDVVHCQQDFLDLCFSTESWVALIAVSHKWPIWDNGLMFKLQSARPFFEIVDEIRPALSKFDAWAIHNLNTAYAESFEPGPLGSVFQRELAKEEPYSLVQMFLMFDSKDRDPDLTTDLIRQSLGEDCAPVFHFKNGKILLLNSTQPPSLIARRCERHLKRLQAWLICDGDWGLFSADGFDPSLMEWGIGKLSRAGKD